MKNLLIYLLLFTLVLSSCDKREDYFKANNEAIVGVLSLNNSQSSTTSTITGTSVIDTMKIGFPYVFSLLLSDENEQVDFYWEGGGSLLLNGSSIAVDATTSIETDVVQNFQWNASSPGTYFFSIVFIDAYEKKTIYDFKIIVFENRVPHISWTLNNVQDLGEYDYRFYVEGIDGDALYGGSILYYEYVVNGDTTNFPWHNMGYVFPGPGSYFVSVRCIDSNNEWSNTVTQANFIVQ